jgi:hypothetical protein
MQSITLTNFVQDQHRTHQAHVDLAFRDVLSDIDVEIDAESVVLNPTQWMYWACIFSREAHTLARSPVTVSRYVAHNLHDAM